MKNPEYLTTTGSFLLKIGKEVSQKDIWEK